MEDYLSTTTVSLCMIVRDEQDNLGQCLSSVRPHVDQLVIVDTGSTDSTVSVAQSFGAEVHRFDATTHPDSFYRDDEATCTAFGAPPPFSGDVALGDFGAARQFSFEQAKCDYVLWLDADDVLEGAENIRAVANDLAQRKFDFAFLAYNYAVDDKGRVFYRQWRERIIRRGAARWVNPVHEVLLPYGNVTTARYPSPLVVHKRKADRRSIPNRNYKILLRQLHMEKLAGIKTDPRTLFYLGQEARFIDARRAAAFYEEYLTKSGWNEERAAAHTQLGQLLEFGMLGVPAPVAFARADMEYATAAMEMPDNPDGLLGMARIAYLRGRWADCVSYTQRAFAIGNTDSMLGANPMDRLYRPHVYLNHALAQLGRLPEAIESCKAALSVCPDDPGVPGGASGMISHNLKFYQTEMSKVQMQPSPTGVVNFTKNEDVDAPPAANIPRDALVIWAMQLWKQCIAVGNLVGARNLIDALPPAVASDPVVAKMRASTERRAGGGARSTPPIRDGCVSFHSASGALDDPGLLERLISPQEEYPGRLSIVFWIGPSIEPWDPTTPNTQGIGGSETAAIEMARELAKRGHKVTVYAEADGVFDGVTYRHCRSATSAIECDVFISSRQPAIMESSPNIHAGVRLLWVHDIHCGPPSPQMERWLYEFDRVLCLSRWHRDFFLATYPTLDPGRVIVTRNGIDPKRFAGIAAPSEPLYSLPSKSNRLIFSSSPNRGLDVLLHLFPHIRERVPNAELHLYYGFDCWEKFARLHGNEKELAAIAEYRRRIDDAVKAGGVHWHGRVNQRQLADAFMRSKVWAYPTTFTETSCVTAMEAQAAGCVPVCTRLAALPETVKHGVLIDPGDSDRFIAEVVRLLKDDSYRAPLAAAGRRYALENLSWAALAGEWEAMFGRIGEENRVSPVPIYREVAA